MNWYLWSNKSWKNVWVYYTSIFVVALVDVCSPLTRNFQIKLEFVVDSHETIIFSELMTALVGYAKLKNQRSSKLRSIDQDYFGFHSEKLRYFNNNVTVHALDRHEMSIVVHYCQWNERILSNVGENVLGVRKTQIIKYNVCSVWFFCNYVNSLLCSIVVCCVTEEAVESKITTRQFISILVNLETNRKCVCSFVCVSVITSIMSSSLC